MVKIGVYSFIIIELNIGQVFYLIFCLCVEWSYRCQARYGYSVVGERFVLVLFKDVVGLVLGVCEGRGRGNKFLNDLLDVDVFVYVIDLFGQIDEDGKFILGIFDVDQK